MQKLILDYSRWRCGDEGKHSLGEGCTALLNDQGFMCCLGQFSKQLNPGLQDTDILGKGEPYEVEKEIPGLCYMDTENRYQNHELSNTAISINDEDGTTPDKKIEQLKAVFAKYSYEIEVINQPEEA